MVITIKGEGEKMTLWFSSGYTEHPIVFLGIKVTTKLAEWDKSGPAINIYMLRAFKFHHKEPFS